MSTDVTRREFLATVAAAHGAFVLGFWMPDKTQAQTPSQSRPAPSGTRIRRRPRSTHGSSSRPTTR
jgi:hypothetical protein